MGSYKKGDTVSWKWGTGTATGTIKEKHKEKVTRQIDGKEISRNGSGDDPAILIEQDDGQRVLKLESEVEKV
jgi:hypothetical protein